MLKQYLPHLTFFTIFFVSALPVLFYIQRKNPNPRFRPGFGEMSLVTLLAISLCGAMALGLGSLFKPENDGKAMSKKPNVAPASQSGTGGSSGSGSKKSSEKDRDSDEDEPASRTLNDRL